MVMVMQKEMMMIIYDDDDDDVDAKAHFYAAGGYSATS